jgi:hypothetical protein
VPGKADDEDEEPEKGQTLTFQLLDEQHGRLLKPVPLIEASAPSRTGCHVQTHLVHVVLGAPIKRIVQKHATEPLPPVRLVEDECVNVGRTWVAFPLERGMASPDDAVVLVNHDDDVFGWIAKRLREARPRASRIKCPAERTALTEGNVVVRQLYEQLDQAFQIRRFGAA